MPQRKSATETDELDEFGLLPPDAFKNVWKPMTEVQKLVAQVFDISPVMINHKSRKVVYATPRMLAMYICAKWQLGQPGEVALAFRKQRKAISNASEKVQGWLKYDVQFRKKYMKCLALLAELCKKGNQKSHYAAV